MKTFKDLVFKDLRTGGKQAAMLLNNGYSISVLIGKGYYSNGIDTYELAILKNNKVNYDTDITSDVLGYINADKVTEVMIYLQNKK